MRRKSMIYVFSTVATMALLLSAFGAANATPSQNQHIAKVGNETVRFNGRSVSIGINGSAYDVGWVLSVLNQSNISTMTFSHYSYKRIINGNQNSYVLIESNSSLVQAVH